MALISLGGAFSSLIVVATELEEELAAGTSEALHASSPSSSDWVGRKSVCLSGGGFLSSSTSGGYFTNVTDIFLTEQFLMGRHFLAAKANCFLPNLPFLPILLDVLIVAFSLVVLTVGVIRQSEGSSRTGLL
jgi:hypothetical protein